MIFDKLKQLGELKKMRDQAMAIQKQLAEEKIEIEENGIRVAMTADQKIRELTIEGQDQSKLIDILNKAMKRCQEAAARKLQAMGGLGGLGGMFGS